MPVIRIRARLLSEEARVLSVKRQVRGDQKISTILAAKTLTAPYSWGSISSSKCDKSSSTKCWFRQTICTVKIGSRTYVFFRKDYDYSHIPAWETWLCLKRFNEKSASILRYGISIESYNNFIWFIFKAGYLWSINIYITK